MRRTWKTKAAILSAAAAVAGAVLPGTAKAANAFWNQATGDFGVGTNWTGGTGTGGLPGSGDIAEVNNSGIMTISGNTNSSNIAVQQLWAGDSSTAGTQIGTIIQTGGLVTDTAGLVVGRAGALGIYNFSGGTINQSGGSAIIRLFGLASVDPTGASTVMYVSNTSSATVVNDSAEFDVGFDNGTVSGAAQLNFSGGTINVTGNELAIGNAATSGHTANGTVFMSGGNMNVSGQLWVGESVIVGGTAGTGGTGAFYLSGGTVTSSNWAVIGRGNAGNEGGTVGVMNISGTAIFNHVLGSGGDFEVGSQGVNETATLNLLGGLLITDHIRDESASGTQTINFNGGMLQANTNDGGFIGGHDGADAPILNVGNNGANFNTSTFTIGVSLAMLHSGTNPTDGGLTKYGTGTLNLSGGSTYNGATTINAGTLNVLSAATSASNFVVNAGTLNLLGSTTGGISVNAGGTVGSYNASGAGGSATGGLTFTGSTTLLVNPTGTQFLTIGGAANASGGSVVVVPTITTASTSPVEILYAKGGIIGTLGGPGSGMNFVPGIRGTLTEAPDASTIGTDLFITAATAGPANLVWTGTNATHPTFWDVQSTVNWFNTGSSSSDQFYAGDNVTFDDTGTTTSIAIQGVSVSPTSVTFNNSTAKSYTLTGGGIAGSGSLSVTGGGMVTLNQSNSYTGATNIANGTLAVGTGGSLSLSTAVSLGSGTSNGVLRLGDATGPVSTPVGTLNVVGTGSGNELIGGNANNSTLTVAGSVFVGTISNPNAILTVGAGATLFGNSGSNPSIGIGPVNGTNGTVIVLAGGTLSADSNDLWVGNGSGGVGNLDISGGTVLANGWIAPGRAGGTGTINMTGGSLIKTGSGNLDIAGDGAGSRGYFYQTGGTVTTSTFVVLGENNANEIGVWNLSGGSTAATVASIIIGSSGNGTVNIFGGAQMNATGGTIVGQNGSAVGALNISNGLENTGGLTASFLAVVNVGSSGVLNVNNGSASTAIASGANTNATLNVLAGGTFNGGNAEVHIGDNAGVGVFNVSGTVIVDNYLAVGRIGGTGTLNLSGSGSITVSNGSNGLTIIGGDGQGNGSVGYFYQTGGSFSSPTNGLELGEQNGTKLDSGIWNFSGGTANLASTSTSITGLTIGGSGTGTVNVSGIAQLNAGNVILANSTVGSSGVLNVSAGTANVRSIDVGLTGTGTVNVTGGQLTSTSLTLASNASSTGVLNLSGGTLTTAGITAGNSTATTPVTVNLNGGTLQALNNTTALISLPSGQPVQIQSGGAIVDSQSFNVGIPATLAGSGGLTKLGTGNLRLSASNSYSGNTTVSAGTLTVANANAVGTGTVTLANHATLALANNPSAIQFTNYNLNAQTPVFVPVIAASQTAVTLTTTTGSDAVSIFDQNQTTISDATGFAASFTYNHATSGPEETGADGVAFVLQGGVPYTVGGAGGVLAYNAAPGFGNSLAAAVDLFLDRLETGSGNGSNGVFTNVNLENSAPIVSQATSGNVTIVYNGTAQTLTETFTSLANGSSTSIVTSGIDAASLLGGSPGGTAPAYLGFTSSTGGVNDVQTISDFKFNANGTTLPADGSNGAIAITNAVNVANSASSTLQLAPTVNYSSGTVGAMNIGSGATLALSVGASPAFNVTHGVLTTPSVTFANSSSGKLDLANNALDITGQSLATVNAMVTSGFSGGTWAGQGIGSTAAATDAHHLTAVGVILNSVDGTTGGMALYGSSAPKGLFDGISPTANTDVLVKYTYYGDANVDGQVDGTDYSRIDSTYLSEAFVNGTPTTPISGWYNGDFNYDNVVNGSDYTLMDNAFNSQGLNIDAAGNPQVQIAAQISGSSAVPEPTSLGLLAIGAAGLLGRRRRRARLVACLRRPIRVDGSPFFK